MGIKKEVKVRHIDQLDKEMEKLWRNYPEEETPKTEPPQDVPEEKVYSYTADHKTVAIVVLSVLVLAFVSGWLFRDHALQDNIENIQYQNKNIWTQNKIIDKANESISGSVASIEESKTVLKDKFQLQYQ